MTEIGFTVTFHSAFRVGAAYARSGVDVTVDHEDPLPADHLKGVMRAAARDVLGLPAGVIDATFGSTRGPSPWSWSGAQPQGTWDFSTRHRVAIDDITNSARKDALVLGELAWAPVARFAVRLVGALDPSDVGDQQLVLQVSGAAVHGLGAWRRRGLGWVGLTPDGPALSGDDIARVLMMRAGAA